MSFESDLLISYAHIDNQSLLEGQTGWVSTLHRILEIRLAQLLGETPRIWRDPKLQGNDYFSETILTEQIPRTAALLTVLSPRYVQSEWCARELEEFCRVSARSGGVRIADKARIFKVIKTPIPRDLHPEPLQPLLGYEFYVTDSQTGRLRELSHFFGPEAERQFLAKLDDLAWDICQLLLLLKKKEDAAPASPAAPGTTVYLSETSFDLREEREAIRRDLLRNGHEVLPDRPLPLVASALDAFLREQLARSALSIHLIGRGYGLVPEGATRSIVALQHEAAARRGLPRLLWLAPGGEAVDERQQRFLEHLRTAPGVHDAAELLEISLEDLKSRIHRKLTPPEPGKERPAAPAAGPVPRVYLICDQVDLEAARPVEDVLFDQGFEVLPTLFEEDEAQARLDHEENLCTCDAVLVFQGQASEMWLRRKLREVQKSAGLGRRQPLLAQGLYLAPPRTPQKERFRTLQALVLREPPDGFSPRMLAPFLDEIVRRRRAEA